MVQKHQIVKLRDILIVIGILLLLGFILLKAFGKGEDIHVPSTFDVAGRSNLLLWMVVAYIIFSIALLWVFFDPKTSAGAGAVIGAGILWGIL